MNCPKCQARSAKRGIKEKIRVISGSEAKYEIEVIVVVCTKCQTILGIVNEPTSLMWDFISPKVQAEVTDRVRQLLESSP